MNKRKRFLPVCTLLLSIAFIGSALKGYSQSEYTQHKLWDILLNKYVSTQGKVDYNGFIKDSVLFNKYLETLRKNPPNTKTWSINAQKAYWINAYNAFTIKLVTQFYPVKSIQDIQSHAQIAHVNSPWEYKFIRIGKREYHLNAIEHDILRKKFDDPRIHAALVCASLSCPALLNNAYNAIDLDKQLDKQMRTFLNDKSRNALTPAHCSLSKIFLWYAGDFTKKGTLIEFIRKYSGMQLQQNCTIDYLDYHWDLND